jgi:parvulin-like peptidyl-prolyl isomerase
MLKRLNRPWLHFLVLGTALFFFLRWLNPPPRPIVGPLNPERVENLKRQWFATAGQAPGPQQLERMMAAELDRDMLFQEALAMEFHLYDNVVRQRLIRNMRFLRLGENKTEDEMYEDALRMELHLGDEVVKRRLIQVMEQILLAQNAMPPPDEAAIVARFKERQEELRRPPRYSIDHVFLTRDRRDEAGAVMQQIVEQGLDPEQARQLSSPFLPGYRFRAQSPEQLARHFGAAFVMNLQALDPQTGQWWGPVESTYGYHLVWLEQLEPARAARLDEVRAQIERDLLLEQRNKVLSDAIARLRQDYEVLL